MEMNYSLPLLVFTNALVVVTLLIHILMSRFISKRGGYRSPQLFLIKLVAVMNVPLLIGLCLITYAESRPFSQFLAMLLFALCIFNGLSYVYFHFFNMSETARGIRILIEIHQKECTTLDKLLAYYPAHHVLLGRLDRLVRMGQVRRDVNGIYYISSRFLLIFVYIFGLLRKLTGFTL